MLHEFKGFRVLHGFAWACSRLLLTWPLYAQIQESDEGRCVGSPWGKLYRNLPWVGACCFYRLLFKPRPPSELCVEQCLPFTLLPNNFSTCGYYPIVQPRPNWVGPWDI